MHIAYAEGLLRKIRLLLLVVIIGLVVSGATALPLETELKLLADWVGADAPNNSAFAEWIGRVRDGVIETNAKYPFLAYGTDWLAFAHFVIAIAFIGPLRDPVRNIWVIDFGIIACLLIIPYAFVFGHIRGIPLWWRLIDCSFGVIGLIPLLFARRATQRLARLTARS